MHRSSRTFWIFFCLICALGIYLRLQQISIQWLTDDEWHAVHKIIQSRGYLPILSSFGRADYSIPLTLYDRLLANTVGLTELRMRLPMLVGGCLFVPLSMLWARSKLGALNSAGFGFLIAISPLLVNYSRNARPYMITLLAAGIGIWALSRWLRTRQRRHLAAYLICAWLGSYLHLIMAPFFLAPLLVLAYFSLRPGRFPPLPLARVTLVGLLAVGGVAALALPPLIHDWSAMTDKTGADLPTLDTLAGVWHVWLGTGSVTVVLFGIALATLGLAPLRGAFATEFPMWLAGLLGIVAAILVMRPAWVHNSLTFGRYLLPALPLLLLLIAAGVGRIAARIGSTSIRRGTVSILLLMPFTAYTPYPELLVSPNNFTLHSYYQFDYRPWENPVRIAFSKFVTPSHFWDRFRNAPPGTNTIAIGGREGFESYFNLQPLYQPYHRQRLLDLQTGGACSAAKPGEAFPSQGVYLKNAVSLSVEGDLKAKGVNWIVIDHRLDAETADGQKTATDPCIDYLVARFGKPAYSDASLQAFYVADKLGRPIRTGAH